MNVTTTKMGDIPPLVRPESLELAEAEYERTVALLEQLRPSDWSQPTECPGWDVRSMVAHLVGAAESHASVREFAHQYRLGRRQPGPLESGISAVQVRERDELTPAELLDRFKRAVPRSIRGRRRTPGVVRALPVTDDSVDPPERWRLGYLLDIIYTRDCWMHRADICRATGRTMALTADHDGRLVADVVAEWARRHGVAFTLSLDGPAGGTYRANDEPGETWDLDAAEFCRIVSGRGDPGARRGLLATRVPF